ncbi:hypothetical protein TRFO_28860 [Tritrichomonas foetus]|uniref:Kelch motif family protein n=1 Tax=Tritrichomonas foetus TaxID=1144522 RepID=A0A1J4K1P9_9EUKA|nr:hypothetical protein TRFO_28860 [Tritrichomonas foetus]|eukprot:OHT03670.1 hypothetical protein TRFO_28860 [Tritrichomonas foetus]
MKQSANNYSKLFPAIGKLEHIKFEKPDCEYTGENYPKVTKYKDTYYLLYEDKLYSYTSSSPFWTVIKNLVISADQGSSLTSTPEGLVLYGGQSENTFYKDMWIYSNAWRPIAGNQIPRAFHAACWIEEKNSLMVHGGICNTGFLSDCVLIDLVTGAVTEINLKTRIPLAYHTATYFGDNIVFLAGGLDPEKRLNSKLYKVNIETGEVEPLIDSFNSRRYCHHAFNFYGFLCIVGGIRYGTKVSNCAIYDTMHKTWLSIALNKLLPKGLFIIYEKSKIKIFDENLKNARDCYFNQNHEPFVDVNDPNLLKFFAELLENNIAVDKQKTKEKQYKTILTNLEKAREKLTGKFLRIQPTSVAPQISQLISEKDQLEQAIVRLEIEVSHQAKRIEKQKANNQKPGYVSSGKNPMEVLSQIEAAKSEFREAVKPKIAKINENMARLTAINGFDPSVSGILSFDKSESDFIIKATNMEQLDQEIKEADEQIEMLNKRLSDARLKKHSLDESYAEGIMYFQATCDELLKAKTYTVEKKKDFINKVSQLFHSKYKVNGKDSSNNSKCQVLQALYSQESKLSQMKKLLEEKVPVMLNDMSNHINSIIKAPGVSTSEIDQVQDIINELIKLNGDAAKVIQDPSEIVKNSEQPKTRARSFTNFMETKFNVADDRWGKFYNEIEETITKVMSDEKKIIS